MIAIIIIIVIIIISIAIVLLTVTVSPNDDTIPDCTLTPLDDLPELLEEGSVCKINGLNTGLYYYPPDDYVMSSVQTSVSSVCNDDTDCSDSITSSSCNGVIPMARIGTVRYYPFSLGNDLCDSA